MVAPQINYGIPGGGTLFATQPSTPTPSYATPGSPAAIGGGIPAQFTSPQANPLFQFAQQGANIGPYTSAMSGIANQLSTAFGSNLDYANQALQLSFDPQQALFKQREQDLIDATRAGEAARGIAMSPYGAGIEANAVGRFQNDWQNEQIARMAQGVQAATGLQSVWMQSRQAAAGIYNNEIQDILQQYNLQGQFMNDALNEILQATKISADVALGQFQAVVGATSGGGGGRGGGGGDASGAGLQMDQGGGGGIGGQGSVQQMTQPGGFEGGAS